MSKNNLRDIPDIIRISNFITIVLISLNCFHWCNECVISMKKILENCSYEMLKSWLCGLLHLTWNICDLRLHHGGAFILVASITSCECCELLSLHNSKTQNRWSFAQNFAFFKIIFLLIQHHWHITNATSIELH